MSALKSPFAGKLSRPAAQQLARALKALADPTRLQIISLLANEPQLSGIDLVRILGISQPTISHHLRVLNQAGLVRWEKRGTSILNSLDRESLGDLVRLLTPAGAS